MLKTMDSNSIKQNELEAMADRLEGELELLSEAVENRGGELDAGYSDKISRAQLESMGEIIESMSQQLGDGDKISVTTPSQLDNE